jgi:hypothetical protein
VSALLSRVHRRRRGDGSHTDPLPALVEVGLAQFAEAIRLLRDEGVLEVRVHAGPAFPAAS